MIVDVLDAVDVLAGAIAAWIAVTAGVCTGLLWATAWGLRGLWRRLTGARRGERGPEAAQEPHGAPEAPETAQNESSYQEAA